MFMFPIVMQLSWTMLYSMAITFVVWCIWTETFSNSGSYEFSTTLSVVKEQSGC